MRGPMTTVELDELLGVPSSPADLKPPIATQDKLCQCCDEEFETIVTKHNQKSRCHPCRLHCMAKRDRLRGAQHVGEEGVMAKYVIPVPGGYEREAGSAFGVAPPLPTKRAATEVLSPICACCSLEFAATRTVRPKRCHPCRMYCRRGFRCAVATKGGA